MKFRNGFAVLALLAAAGAAQAQITVGAHLYTAHADSRAEDDTTGLYAVAPSGIAGGRLVAGFFRNSLNLPGTERRTSAYLGNAWQRGRWGLMLGAGTGYERECREAFSGTYCWGWSKHRIAPMVVPSMTIPEAAKVIGVTPRLSLVRGNGFGIHLSIEKAL